MKHRVGPVLYLVLLVSFALISLPAAAQQPCESLASIKIPNVTITSAKAGSPGFELPAQAGLMNMPATKIPVPFCRVEAYSAPTSDSHIAIEVWLPVAANWNGKFLAAGNPGFIGSLSSAGLAGIMQRGYVAAGTDTGHVDMGFEWAIGHPEKWADWGYRAVHETVERDVGPDRLRTRVAGSSRCESVDRPVDVECFLIFADRRPARQDTFAGGDDHCPDRVTCHVCHRAAHVEQAIDAEDQRDAGFRDSDGPQHDDQHDDSHARHRRRADGCQCCGENDGKLLRQG